MGEDQKVCKRECNRLQSERSETWLDIALIVFGLAVLSIPFVSAVFGGH